MFVWAKFRRLAKAAWRRAAVFDLDGLDFPQGAPSARPSPDQTGRPLPMRTPCLALAALMLAACSAPAAPVP
ncbi:MAG: hypothetical protein VR74_01865, partial [Hyphomonas sp. BRH_c22]